MNWPTYISKFTFLRGRQCSKLLWFRNNAKDQIPATDEAQQAVFDQGTEVGELAQQLFPGVTGCQQPWLASDNRTVFACSRALLCMKSSAAR